ncbi:MAG TPA: hypothetical protein VM095_01805 [Pyrinomonadaceae bacterium]|nr:hypothetical protein [Pyrinomonadaceae bacterium]
MNVRKHIDGFAVFLIILIIAVAINEYLTFPNFKARSVRVAAPPSQPKPSRRQPVAFKVRQVSLDYINRKSYTELNLFHELDQPAPETVWVTTTYYSPDSARAEDWTVTTKIDHPFDKGNGEIFVAASDWDLPPLMSKPGAGYFARVDVSSEYQGRFYDPDYHYSSDPRNAVPVVIHWPDDSMPARASKKFSR